MTTTGDLFINIKGNNQGLKRTLNQSSRDISAFGKQTERTMSKGGIGIGEMLGIGAVSNAQTLMKGVQAMNARRKYTAMDNIQHRMGRGFAREDRKFIGPRPAIDAAVFREGQGSMSAERAKRGRLRRESRAVRPTMAMMLGAPGVLAAVTGLTATILATNGTKWAKRINESAMSYSGAAIGNQARIDAANMRRDIQLARQNSNSAVARQNAADFRRNSGAGGNVTNYLGAAWDSGVGAASNAVFGIPGLIMNIKQVSETFGGPK